MIWKKNPLFSETSICDLGTRPPGCAISLPFPNRAVRCKKNKTPRHSTVLPTALRRTCWRFPPPRAAPTAVSRPASWIAGVMDPMGNSRGWLPYLFALHIFYHHIKTYKNIQTLLENLGKYHLFEAIVAGFRGKVAGNLTATGYPGFM